MVSCTCGIKALGIFTQNRHHSLNRFPSCWHLDISTRTSPISTTFTMKFPASPLLAGLAISQFSQLASSAPVADSRGRSHEDTFAPNDDAFSKRSDSYSGYAAGQQSGFTPGDFSNIAGSALGPGVISNIPLTSLNPGGIISGTGALANSLPLGGVSGVLANPPNGVLNAGNSALHNPLVTWLPLAGQGVSPLGYGGIINSDQLPGGAHGVGIQNLPNAVPTIPGVGGLIQGGGSIIEHALGQCPGHGSRTERQLTRVEYLWQLRGANVPNPWFSGT
ncbi:uncharacterized protein EI90DRAFT_637386 [Cantharellus anzutake]|uniref:uncharacterized protein n=1 Tax=Cantharellus anzutake TaxID=1750568 RepID=UPI0019069661|nr:uncharacterized protein EI90DRAFT_637386 [Cantharellus anzutake]KAF8333173.1 hypothetical protein EI90DRAFT_637386 [Cantharellus anzutake]